MIAAVVLPFGGWIPASVFWFALGAWALTAIGMAAAGLRRAA